ncbi:MAG: class I SAM-dependent methyltransferase [Alphaproteobacteria bacterium]|nr:class I SAM-dependent methyltransferase [Alphaproteobacteria bacterium]
MAAVHQVHVTGVPAWIDPERLLGPGSWQHVDGAWSAVLSLPAAADLAARLRGLGFAGQPLVVDVHPRLPRAAVRAARTADAVRRRTTTPGFTRPGTRLDDEGRWSLTPEVQALALGRQAARLGERVHVLDVTAGCGGNAIGFARAGCTVTAIERDPGRAALCRHNVSVYGVADRVAVHVGDAIHAAAHHDATVLFVDPPWGTDWSRQGCTLDDVPLLADVLAASAGRFAHVWAKVPPSFDPASTPGARPRAWFGQAEGDARRVKWVLLAWP